MTFTRATLTAAAVATVLLTTGCSSSDDAAPSSGPTLPGNTITAMGGRGGSDGGFGGRGEEINFDKYGPGNLEVRRAGTVDASFTPSSATASLGSNPAIVNSDTTVVMAATAADKPASGGLYVFNYQLRISDGNTGAFSSDEVATGLQIASGATLTLPLNYFASQAYFYLSNDVDNRGTITVADVSATQRGGLTIDANGSYIGSGVITTQGTQPGQAGGSISIYAANLLLNSGPVNASGADASTGAAGNGASIYLEGRLAENTAEISSRGGNAASGAGGNGGSVNLRGDERMFNSGAISTQGGTGTTSGGQGGSAYVSLDDAGELRNTAAIDTRGGAASAGNAGGGGQIGLYADGVLRTSGTLVSRGGDSTAPAGNGGSGGSMYLETDEGYFSGPGIDLPAGDLLVSGNIDSSGGSAVATGTGSGGDAGNVYIELGNYSTPEAQRLVLLGYDRIDNSSGDANYPQDAYVSIGFNNDYGEPNYNNTYVAGGSIINEAQLIGRGGNVVADATNPALGGRGHYVYLETDYDYGANYPDGERLDNSGLIDTRPGTSLNTTSTTWAGGVWMWGYNGVQNSGELFASGANDLGTDGGATGRGNNADDVEIYAQGPVANTGAVHVSGGAGEYVGGSGGYVSFAGTSVNNGGAVNGTGGNADASLAGSAGGDGAFIEMYVPGSTGGVTNSGALSITGGTGETAGTEGGARIAGACVAGTC